MFYIRLVAIVNLLPDLTGPAERTVHFVRLDEPLIFGKVPIILDFFLHVVSHCPPI
jgi:hypothetical protein